MGFEKIFDGCKKKEVVKSHGFGGGFYFLGFLGALIYYISTSTSFWDGLFGFFKALLWPAALIYQLLVFLGA